jgi:hypothetical protein
MASTFSTKIAENVGSAAIKTIKTAFRGVEFIIAKTVGKQTIGDAMITS